MTSAVGQKREIDQLKSLLFQAEAARLQALETDVASLRDYVGGADRLEAATADVLVAALERAEVERPRELANAVAPLVVSAIRSEIANSRDMMVDALYPLTGRLVSAAVRNAFKELVASLEQRVSALTSTELWIGRIKSLATGRPLGEFVLADSSPLLVNRLLVIERGNGRLIADWTRAGASDDRADLLSAMVAAILEFSVQALAGEGNLQQLDFGGREIVLRASPRFILAAECIGPLRPADNARINSLFFDMIESIDRGSTCDAAMLSALATSIESDPLAGKKTNRSGRFVLLTLVALAGAALAWLTGTYMHRAALEGRANSALEQFVKTQPLLESFPLRLDFDHGNRNLTVSGIEPSQLNISPLVDVLGKVAAPYRIVERIGVLPGLEETAALRSDVTATQQSLTRLQAGIEEARGLVAEEAKTRDQQYAGLSKQYADLSKQYADLSKRYAELQSVTDGPAERLNRFMGTTAVFFGNADEFVDNGEAERQIQQLAGLLANNDLKIRIVGYTDDTGSELTNRALSRKRADQVARRLTALGINPSRLLVVSRSAAMPISDGTGPTNNGNRRVAFEAAFQTEPAP